MSDAPVLYVREFRERNLLSRGSRNEKIANLPRARAELRLHAHDQVEELLALNHLRGRLPADGRLHHRFDVGDVNSVARDLRAVRIDDQAGLSKFANHGKLGEARSFVEHVADFHRFLFEHAEVGAEDFYRERALETCERFVYGVFRRLRIVENHPGIRLELFLNVFNEFGFRMNRTLLPRFVIVRLKPDIKLTIKKTRGIRAVIRPPKLRADDRDHRILVQQVADFRREFSGVFVPNRIRQSSPDPQSAFVEMRQELSANERNQNKRGTENEYANEQRCLGMVETPGQPAGVAVADPFEDTIVFFFHTALEPVRSQHRHKSQRE